MGEIVERQKIDMDNTLLLNDFFTIREYLTDEEDKKEIIVDLNKEHDIFEGHFPTDAIVPGVCLTQMLTDILSEIEGETYYLSASNQIKFISLVRPRETPSFYINIAVQSRTEDAIKLSVKYYKDETIYFKMKGTYKKQL